MSIYIYVDTSAHLKESTLPPPASSFHQFKSLKMSSRMICTTTGLDLSSGAVVGRMRWVGPMSFSSDCKQVFCGSRMVMQAPSKSHGETTDSLSTRIQLIFDSRFEVDWSTTWFALA